MKKKLEDVLLTLIVQCATHRGAGFGKYPLGMLDAIRELMPLADPNYRTVIGREHASTLAQCFAELEELLK